MTLERRHGSPSTAGIGLLQNTRTGDPWIGQPKYTKGIVATLSIIIAIYALATLHTRWQQTRRSYLANPSDAGPKASKSRPGPWARVVATLRVLAYRRLPSYRLGLINLRLPVLGATLAMSAFMLGFTIWTFVVQPYYRVDRSFGSPPLALRSGMMALGLMPFIYVLGSKVNFISLLTGVSHEKLQVYHQWLARFMLFLSTVHALPFIHQPLADGGVEGLRETFFSDSINTTGVIAYACLFVLSFASMTSIRERCYELFLLIHVPVAIVFLGYMFVHCQAMLTSWRYLWATAAMYMLSVFLRFAMQLRQNSFLTLSRCRIEALPCSLAKITVDSTMRWRPGQHVFVRFPGLAPLTAHPFTIVSMPAPDEQQLVSTVVLMAKARNGLTKQLYELASKAQSDSSASTLSAILDGPYGQDASIAGYDHVLLLAGGSGITFVLASLLELAWLWEQKAAATRRVHLVWSVRDEQAISWAREHLIAIHALAPPGSLQVSIFISDPAASSRNLDLPAAWDLQWGVRPDAASLVHELASNTTSPPVPEAGDIEKTPSSPEHERACSSSTAAVVVCGPTGMVEDASNAAVRVQSDIARAKLASLHGLTLITESFGF